MKKIEIFTDGACSGNPGKGGYGAVLIYGEHRKEISEGFRLTTNNRMEILGVLEAFRCLKKPCDVTLCSDSKYVIDALVQGWAYKWRENSWMRTKRDKALNVDLWEPLLTEIEKHNVTYKWVKGHAGHPENERCDRLAVAAGAGAVAEGKALPPDTGYQPDGASLL